MIKVLSVVFLLMTCSFGAASINHKLADPKNCSGCHAEQYNDWKTTWHSKAHEKNNPLFSSVVDYVKLISHKTKADVLTHCAKCHNPKLQIKSVSDSYMYAKAFGVETSHSKKIDSALVAKHTQTGISCFICHNIDKLDDKNSTKEGGLDVVHWTKGDLIVGPFTKNNRPGFHQMEQREHFLTGNKLCLTCHQGSGNYNDLDGYQTGEEIATQPNSPRCVECHMSSTKKSVIAPTITRQGELPVVRNIRSHIFAGARNSKVLENTVSLLIQPKIDNIEFYIKNLTPHRAPTGFSGRSLVVEFTFYDKNKKVIGKQSVDFRAIYEDKYGNEALSYVAKNLKKDTRLKPNELRVIKLERPKNASMVTVNIWYYLLAPSLQKIIDVEPGLFTKKYLAATASAKL